MPFFLGESRDRLGTGFSSMAICGYGGANCGEALSKIGDSCGLARLFESIASVRFVDIGCRDGIAKTLGAFQAGLRVQNKPTRAVDDASVELGFALPLIGDYARKQQIIAGRNHSARTLHAIIVGTNLKKIFGG